MNGHEPRTDSYPFVLLTRSQRRIWLLWDQDPKTRHITELWNDICEPGDDQAERAVLTGARFVAETAAELGVPVRLACTGQAPEVLNRVAWVVANSPVDTAHPADPQVLAARRAVEQHAGDVVGARRDPGLPADGPVVIATDCSRSFAGGRATASWVRGSGVWHVKRLTTHRVNDGELAAITSAVKHAPADRDLLILTDSRAATQIALGRVAPSTFFETCCVESILRRVSAYRQIEIRWVKGHSGVPLNEAAHRLAVNELRRHKFGVEKETSRTIMANIVEELRGQFDLEPPPATQPWAGVVSAIPASGLLAA